MSKIEDELKEGQTKATPFFFGQLCLDKNWILQSNQSEQINHLICLICKQVAHNPVEISCTQHKDMDESLIVGEDCLQQFLENNHKTCPIQPHDGCEYYKMKSMQRHINDLMVVCPRQFQQDLKTLGKNEEGQTPGGTTSMCNFKGKIKDLEDHLNNSCSLRLVNCWFELFGCKHSCFENDLKKHLISEMKYHFDLVMKKVESIQESRKQHEEAKQLQLENERLKVQMDFDKRNQYEEVLKVLNENAILKQDIINSNNHQTAILNELEKLKQEVQLKDKIILEKNEQIKKNQEKQNANKELSSKSKNEHLSTLDSDFFHSSSKQFKTFTGHAGIVWSIDYSTFDDCQLICSGSADKTVRVWDVETNNQIQSFNGHSNHVYCVKFSPYHYHNNRQNVICSSSGDTTIRFWDIKDNRQLQMFNGHNDWVGGIEFSPFNGGRYLCSGSSDKTICLWDVETSKTLYILNGHERDVCCVSFSSLQSNNNNSSKGNNISLISGNGYTVCSGSLDKTVRVWDIETAKQLNIFEGHEGYVWSVKYGSNELRDMILSGSQDKSIRLWDIRSGKQIQAFIGHTSCVSCVEHPSFVVKSSDTAVEENVICSGSWDNTIRFWDIRSNKVLHVLKGDDKKDCGIYCLKLLGLKKNESTKNSDTGLTLCYGSSKGVICVRG
ncbi:WD-40 repeat protein [Reticulomyxa filosa]|uniref:WD-40 repeat protein n=1 Tax=Reticulomyxa filosa TaxID=46433 RepID=X6NN92_RETFI|nr:WD-40 repeat protein [Reticulomyxa filosa]|eukprot:ETO27446.1 WD-40 repeat protein [Reticulomyxa filosa]